LLILRDCNWNTYWQYSGP